MRPSVRAVDGAGGLELVGGDRAKATRPFWSSSQAVCSSGTTWTLTLSSSAGDAGGEVALQGQGAARGSRGGQAEGAVAGRVGQVGGRVGAGQGRGQRGQGDGGDQGREVGEGAVEADDQGGRVGVSRAGDGVGAAGEEPGSR